MALDPLSALLDIGGKVIDRVWPDPAQAAAAKLELFKLQQSGELAPIAGQMEVNKVEAANPSRVCLRLATLYWLGLRCRVWCAVCFWPSR